MEGKNTAETALKKAILCAAGSFVLALGIPMFLESALGSDPMTLIVDGVRISLGVTSGTAMLWLNIGYFALALLLARKSLGVGTVINFVLTSLFADFWTPVVRSLLAQFPGTLSRIVMVLLGEIILAAGIGIVVAARFGIGSLEAVHMRLSEIFHIPYRVVRVISDLLFSAAGWLLGGIVGMGTLYSLLTHGSLITFFTRIWNRTLCRLLGIEDERNELN